MMKKLLKGYLAVLGAITLWQMAKRKENGDQDQSDSILKLIMLIPIVISICTLLGLEEVERITSYNVNNSAMVIFAVVWPLITTAIFIATITCTKVAEFFPILACTVLVPPLFMALFVMISVMKIVLWQYANGYSATGSLLISLLCLLPLIYSIVLNIVAEKILRSK